MKADFPVANELEEEVRRQAKEWKTLSFTKKSKMNDFWSKAVQKNNLTNESLPTISQETTERVSINDKTNPQPSKETPPTNNTAAPTPAQEEIKQKINTENDILVGLYRKWDVEQLSLSDSKEITAREATLRKYKANLKQKEATHKQQLKFRVNQ